MKPERYEELVYDLARVLVKAGFAVEARGYLMIRLNLDVCSAATIITDMVFSETEMDMLSVMMTMMLAGRQSDVQDILCMDEFMLHYDYADADWWAVAEMNFIISKVLMFPVEWKLVFKERSVHDYD